MYNVSVEQIIKTKAPKKAIVFKIIMILACILAVTTIPSTYALGILLLAVLVIFTVLLFKFYNAEYEYSLTENELIIDKIMARSMRRRCGVYNVARASLIATPGSQDALRMEYKQLRTASYTANDGMEGVVVMYTLNNENEMVRVYIQPNQKLLEAMKAVAQKDAFKVEQAADTGENHV